MLVKGTLYNNTYTGFSQSFGNYKNISKKKKKKKKFGEDPS